MRLAHEELNCVHRVQQTQHRKSLEADSGYLTEHTRVHAAAHTQGCGLLLPGCKSSELLGVQYAEVAVGECEVGEGHVSVVGRLQECGCVGVCCCCVRVCLCAEDAQAHATACQKLFRWNSLLDYPYPTPQA